MAEKNYKVRFISLFEWDLAEITDYISHHLRNPQTAYLLAGEIEKAIMDRLTCPESFEPYPSYLNLIYPFAEYQRLTLTNHLNAPNFKPIK